MIHKYLMVWVIVIISLCGCTSPLLPSTSSGFYSAKQLNIPEGIPKTIGVLPFAGDNTIAIQASDQFSGGLLSIGFTVIERGQLMPLLAELNFENSDYVDPATRNALRKQFGVEGVFIGSITGESRNRWVDTHLNIRLIDTETGKIIWTASVHDPRRHTKSLDIRTSAVHTVNAALEILKNDLWK